MFGYLKIHKDELLVREYDAYKAVYCGLCRQLGKEYSFISRLMLSYDCTFYSILLMSLDRTCNGFKNGRCTCNPFKKCSFALCSSNTYSKASALSVISVYYKLKDDITDSGFFKRCFLKFLQPLPSHWRKKALRLGYSDIDKIVGDMMIMQNKDEQSNSSTIDSAAHPTAFMLGSILALEANNDTAKRVFYEFGYHIGRWIYFIDAADDIKKDKQSGNFNPFINTDIASAKYIDSVLSQCLARAFEAYSLMNLTDFKGILDNMMLKGLPSVQNKIIKKLTVEVVNEQSL